MLNNNMHVMTVFLSVRTLTTNRRPLTVSIVVHYRDVGQQFYVGPDCFVIRNVFLSVFFGGSMLQLRWARACFRLDILASLSLLQYVCTRTLMMVYTLCIVYSYINYLFAGYCFVQYSEYNIPNTNTIS